VPAAVLTVTPDTDLLDLDQIELHGTGFPQARGVVTQCVVDGPCEPQPSVNMLGDADGIHTSARFVHVRTDLSGVPGGNCMTTACEIRVTLDDGTLVAHAPLTFRAGQPIPPFVNVTPATGLRHDQTVLVTGDSFPVGAEVFLTECPDGATNLCAETLQSTSVGADGQGRIAAFVTVSRILATGPSGFVRYTDCATASVPCTIAGVYAGSSGPIGYGSGPLSFDASTAPPGTPPSIGWAPPRVFQAVETPVFDLANFTPAEPVRGRFCAFKGLASVCGAWVTATADASGTAHLPIEVRRVSVGSDGSDFDCLDGAICSVGVEGKFAYEKVRTFVDFDPSSPIPGRPVLTLHDLSVTEGSDGGQTPARMRITLSEPASTPLTVWWSTDVVIPYQFNPPGGVITIPAGAVEATLPLRVVADRTHEADETVPVGIGVGRGYSVAGAKATLRIVDDDVPSADPPAVAYIDLGEGIEGNLTARATISLAAPVQHTVTVHYHTVDATAVAGSDYVAKRSSIVLRPGEFRHVLRFQLVDDHVREGREHFHVVISKVDGGIAARGNNVDIFDDDPAS
jgi:hypothetical protein